MKTLNIYLVKIKETKANYFYSAYTIDETGNPCVIWSNPVDYREDEKINSFNERFIEQAKSFGFDTQKKYRNFPICFWKGKYIEDIVDKVHATLGFLNMRNECEETVYYTLEGFQASKIKTIENFTK